MITFIRHGESAANAGEKTTDTAIIPLTKNGEEQARIFAENSSKPDLIIHSPYLRAFQTAIPLIQKFNDVKVIARPVYEFTYLSQDRCFNTNQIERAEMVKGFWHKNDFDHQDSKAVESFSMFIKRIKDELCFLEQFTDREVVVFCHERVINAFKCIVRGRLQIPLQKEMGEIFRNMPKVHNCEIYEINFDTERGLWVELEKFKKVLK